MLLAVPGVPTQAEALRAVAGLCRHLAGGGAAAAFNCLIEQGIDARMKAHRLAPHGARRSLAAPDPAVQRPAVRSGHGHPGPVGQCTDHVADAGHLRRLCRGLHRGAQAAHPAEHRHRRRFRGHAARAGLGGHAWRGRARSAHAVPDHLLVDAAALLGPGPLPCRRLRQGRSAHAARHPRQRLHASACAALHPGPAGRHLAALHLRHEWLALPGRGGGAERLGSCSWSMPFALWRRYSPTHWPARPSASPSST
jgi:hypothetical protein